MTSNDNPEPGKAVSASDKHWLEYATFIVATLGFIAALLAAIFAFWQAWIAQDTEKRQLRAYIVEDGADLQGFGIGSKAQVEVLFVNMGQTPAHDAVWLSELAVLDYTGGQTFSPHECRLARNAPENPKWMVGKSKQFTKYWPTAFTAEEVARVQAGTAVIYFHGRFCYLDIFEEERHSDFCMYWKFENGRFIMRRCPKGNSAS